MAKKNIKGLFITFEGSEGCGKSTQSHLLYKHVRQEGFDAVYLREPGGTAISEHIRNVLLDAKNEAMTAECELLLYMAARSQLVTQVIRPALQSGKIVICDRFLDSTIAYQGYGLGISIDFIERVGEFVTQGIAPDITVFMDLPIKKGLKHREVTKDRIEQRTLNYHQKVRRGYLALARRYPRRIKVIRVEKDLTVTQENVRKAVFVLIEKGLR